MAAKYPIPAADKIFALSCINVGVGPGGTTSMVARVSIVNFQGQRVVDVFVAPTLPVTDYRTSTTGLEPADLAVNKAVPFEVVQQHVADIIKCNILVGHSLWNDLSVLGIPHPAVSTRDVGLYQPFRNALRANQIVGLQTLMWHLMARRCQEDFQDPLENARATMDLYRSHAEEWETAVSKGHWPCNLPPSSFSRCYL